MLKIGNLQVSRAGVEIIKGIDLNIGSGEVHAIMGPNGSGKSTLSLAIAGFGEVKVSNDSKITIDNVDITKLSIDDRVKKGLFLAFQNPVEVRGVPYLEFLRLAYNNIHIAREGNSFRKVSPFKFRKLVLDKISELGLSEDFLERNLNEGFSGGEKKKSEILQLLILEPKYIILDEIDSGLDVTALRLVASVINKVVKENNSGVLVITHYNRILEYLNPNYVHVLKEGKIVKTGDKSLALDIEQNGYDKE